MNSRSESGIKREALVPVAIERAMFGWCPGSLTRLGGNTPNVAGSSPSLAVAQVKATKLCFCRHPVLPLFSAGISTNFCLLRLSKMVCSLLLVQDAQCINFLAVLPANHLDFVNGTSASRIRNIVCLKFETEICSKGTNSLKSQNSKRGLFVIFLKSGQTPKSLLNLPSNKKKLLSV